MLEKELKELKRNHNITFVIAFIICFVSVTFTPSPLGVIAILWMIFYVVAIMKYNMDKKDLKIKYKENGDIKTS